MEKFHFDKKGGVNKKEGWKIFENNSKIKKNLHENERIWAKLEKRVLSVKKFVNSKS